MSALIYDPGPFKFTIKDRKGNKYEGECFAVSISHSISAHEKAVTTIQFSGHKVIQTSKLKKKKKAKRKRNKSK